MIFARAIFWPDDENEEKVREDIFFFLYGDMGRGFGGEGP